LLYICIRNVLHNTERPDNAGDRALAAKVETSTKVKGGMVVRNGLHAMQTLHLGNAVHEPDQNTYGVRRPPLGRATPKVPLDVAYADVETVATVCALKGHRENQRELPVGFIGI